MDLLTVNRRKNFYTMGTTKTVILEKISCPWRLLYATRVRVCGASAAHWTSARLPLRPPAAPSSHTPMGKSIPRLIKSSTHFRARFIEQALQNMQAHSTQN
jgi:hypothetical protein